MLWTPAEGSGPRPLVLIGHGGGQHKKEPGVLSRAFPYVTSCGFAVAAIDAPGTGDRPEHPEIKRLVAEIQEREAAGEPAGPAWPALSEIVASQLIPDWQATLDALQELDCVGDSQPVGYYGLSQGGEMGIRLVAAEPRITAAVLGLIGSDVLTAPRRGSRSRSSSCCSGTMRASAGFRDEAVRRTRLRREDPARQPRQPLQSPFLRNRQLGPFLRPAPGQPGRCDMKNLIIVGGTAGVGKTTTCRELQKILPRNVFLDGDWCWDMRPFLVTGETKKMVESNIAHLLNNFLDCSEFENVIFCWVLHQQKILDDLIARKTIATAQ